MISVEQDGEISIYQVDGLGSTRVLTDLDGNVVADYNYEAFGELIDSTGDVENDYLFAGEQFDGDLGQYYLRQRFYDQNVGRFTRRDVYEGRSEEPLTLHKYLYAHSDPINGTDPSGYFTISEASTINKIIATLAAIQSVTHPNAIQTTGSLNIPVIEATAKAFSTTGRATEVISQQYGIPAIVWGGDLPQTTQHIHKALTGSGYTLGNEQGLAGGSQPITPLLSRIPRDIGENLSGGSRWYTKFEPCSSVSKNKTKGSDGRTLVCDEYPYLSTIQGGLSYYLQGQVSISPVLASEQTGTGSQGAKLSSFYPKAGVSNGGIGDPNSWFLTFAVPSEGVSYWIDRKGQRRNF